MKALREIGFLKAVRFLIGTLICLGFGLMPFPPLRVWYLRLFGARVGKNSVIHGIRFFNYYRGGFGNLTIGDYCFLGDEVVFDLAAPISLGNHVTMANRSAIITHLNVGYHDHPLQSYFPSHCRPVTVEEGCFIGFNSVILDGVTIGAKSFVGACSLVKDSLPGGTFVAGVPVRTIKNLDT